MDCPYTKEVKRIVWVIHRQKGLQSNDQKVFNLRITIGDYVNTGTICQWHEDPSGNRTGALIKADGEGKEVLLSARNFNGDINSLELDQRVEFEIYELTIAPGIPHAKNCRLLETIPAASITDAVSIVSIPTDEDLSSEDPCSAAPESDSQKSPTHLILTVGTNALPVWVAWYHLKKHLDNPKVGFVYTDETENRKKCLEADAEDTFPISPTSPGDPKVVQYTINNMSENLPDNIHVHYTGGTQVMGVETVSTIATRCQAVAGSYLDARSGAFPIIRNRDGNQIGPKDAREGICPDIEKIAKLNGFKLESENADSPEAPDMEDAGKIITFAGTSNEWLKCAAWAALKSSLKRLAEADKKRGNYKVFRDVTITPEKSGSNKIKLDVVAVLGYQVIVIACSTLLHEEDEGKNQKGDRKRKSAVKMEAIRAYYQAKQLGGDEARTIILCGLDSLSLDKDMPEKLQNELHHDIGSEDVPLQVWGNSTWDQLEERFDEYLKNDVIWGAKSNADPTQEGDAKFTPATPEDAANPSQIQNLLLFTVGTNALPIWVAWYYLKEELQNATIGFVYTEKTRETMKRLKEHFECKGTSNFLYLPLSAPGNPKVIRNAINGMLENLPQNSKIHVHYTGGTQVMGVETVSTIAAKRQTAERSYLDARSKPTPQIVDGNGTAIQPEDARQGICPDIKHIAKLNGFEVSKKQFGNADMPDDPTDFACDNLDTANLQRLQNALNNLNNKNNIVGDKQLEYAALAALKQALEKIKCNRRHAGYKRDNYALFGSVYVRRKKVEESDEPEPFELDVVAVLGYQIVVVTCTITDDKSLIRKKAAEAYLRAQQLGGDEARTIVLCRADEPTGRNLEKELEIDTGSRDVVLPVWGQNKWRNLSANFRQYLEGLGWK